MKQQLSLAQAEYAGNKKTTRRDKFFAEMNLVVPWARLVELLRVYLLQHWYGLADEALEDTIYDSQAMRGFAGIDLGGSGSVPDASTLLNFRHLLEEHELTKRILEEADVHLTERGLLMLEGTLVDATIVAAPSSTKNKGGQSDPEMHQTKKGNQWFFSMKAHIGADAASGVVHSVTGTAANVSGISQTRELLRGEEKVVHADACYIAVEKREEIIAKHSDVEWQVTARRGKLKARTRALVEHPFHLVKNVSVTPTAL
jgi:transposase, IS5 family